LTVSKGSIHYEGNCKLNIPVIYPGGLSSGSDKISGSTLYPLYFSQEYAESGSQLKEYNYRAAAKIVDARYMGQEAFLEVIRTIGADYGIMRQYVNEKKSTKGAGIKFRHPERYKIFYISKL